MALFQGIKQASSALGGNYLAVGVHEVEIVKITQGKARKGFDFVSCSVTLLGSSNPKYAVGSKADVFYSAKPDTNWLGDVKNLAIAVMGALAGEAVADDAVDEEVMDGLVAGDGTAAAGVRLRCNAFEVPTKRGGVFTKYVFEPIFTAAR